MRAVFLALLFSINAASAANESVPAPWVQPGATQNLPQAALLTVGIAVFESGLQASNTSARAAALRQAEARYVPYFLRNRLADSEQWGSVRLLPAADDAFELIITGTVVASSARNLALHVVAADATGRRWIDRTYQDYATTQDYEDTAGEPFAELYDRLLADLASFRQSLTLGQLQEIITVARLRYAASLVPEAFAGYLKTAPGGTLSINRLPARQDPLWVRIDRVRQAHDLFADAVDQQYRAYGDELAPTYTAWRQITARSQATMGRYRQIEAGRDGRKSAQSRYNDLREVKLHEQTLRESISAFAFEVGPTTVDLDGELVELTGSLSEQSRRWRSILSELYMREVGL